MKQLKNASILVVKWQPSFCRSRSVIDQPYSMTNIVSEPLMQGSFFNDLFIVQTLNKAEVAFLQVLY